MKIICFIFLFMFTNYDSVKNSIEKKRIELHNSYKASNDKNEILEKASTNLAQFLMNDIVNNWYGTKWSFEGHSEQPKQGTIACGYFVSTTLRDVGFNLNRYKLAQKSPEDEAKVLSCGTKVEKLQNSSKKELKAYFLKQKEGVYFIGLDFHVGFIYKTKTEIYFIHSNYIDNIGVVKEKIEDSKAVSSNNYFIVNLSNNKNLIKKWLLKEIIRTN